MAPPAPATEPVDDGAAPPDPATGEVLVEDELLVEEISIDGMCGVY
jgi:mycofactocin precursor